MRVPDATLQRGAVHQCRVGAGNLDSRPGRNGRAYRWLSRRNRVGQIQTRRHTAQSYGHLAACRPWLEAASGFGDGDSPRVPGLLEELLFHSRIAWLDPTLSLTFRIRSLSVTSLPPSASKQAFSATSTASAKRPTSA